MPRFDDGYRVRNLTNNAEDGRDSPGFLFALLGRLRLVFSRFGSDNWEDISKYWADNPSSQTRIALEALRYYEHNTLIGSFQFD